MKCKTIKRLSLFGILVLFSAGLAIGSGTALGFVLLGNRGLSDAARWSNVPESLVEKGVRGLGGGIEYAIADDFCEKIIPTFFDEPKPACEQVKELVKRAFDKWAAGHPILKFVDVTGKVKAERPPQGRDPSKGFGAEIDIFAEVSSLPAVASLYSRWDRSPIGTNGKELPGHTITSADIVFSSGWCYFIDPALLGQRRRGLGCHHFETVMMHEIGHALGLDHPTSPEGNYDSDDDPTNEIPIDCEDPATGLKISPNLPPHSILGGAEDPVIRVAPQLTNDDIGGRNFLYPICPSASQGEMNLTPPAAPLSASERGRGRGLGQASPASGD